LAEKRHQHRLFFAPKKEVFKSLNAKILAHKTHAFQEEQQQKRRAERESLGSFWCRRRVFKTF
jgi:hypothetical protein